MGSENEKDQLTIVGIGASAGGLEAIQGLFADMPEKTGLAFVIIQHLSPDYKSLMAELLARYTDIRIKKAEDNLDIEADTIYLIPPRKNMTVFKNRLFLEEQKKTSAINLPIDIFFRSLAKDKGKKAVGIILSGTGSDGTLGIRAIKEAGGMAMVQSQDTAKFDGMPRSSIATGQVDYVLEPSQMPAELLNYVKHPFLKKSKQITTDTAESTSTLSKILNVLRDDVGTDFSSYKENTVVRRIERRMGINRFHNLEQYLSLLKESHRERKILYKELLIGVTRFFRDEEAFESLKSHVFPDIAASNKEQLRFWVVACSTGEEVYSLGIKLLEYMNQYNISLDVKIFATDIDREAIEYASAGFYPDSIVSDVPEPLLLKYFNRKGNGYQVTERLRQIIIFATHNVLSDPPFPKIDLISCRNLFIYIKPEIQVNILSMFYFALNPGGYLFMGSSETIGDMAKAFSIIDAKHKIFRYKEGYQEGPHKKLPLPHLSHAVSQTNGYQVNRKKKTSRFEHFLQDQIENIFVPPSVVIDEHYSIVKIYNDINPFLKFPKGSFTQDLFLLVSEELKMILRSLLRKVKIENKPVLYQNIKNILPKNDKKLDIGAEILHDNTKNTLFFLISFHVRGTEPTSENYLEKQSINVSSATDSRVQDLENELQYTKENLQATVEELETSNEELQSSNEELIASNEELQSTNEELQSVNEELYTVNTEHENKIEELTLLNNDMDNLLKNTNIGTLYLDKKLAIRKFTPVVTEVTSIRETDIGRPVFHLDFRDIYVDFISDIQNVLNTLEPKEKEISKNKMYYMVRIMPYRTENNAVQGIIITFVDVTSLKNIRDMYEATGQRLQNALEAGGMAWWEWDVPSGKVIYDKKKAEMAGYTKEEFPNNVYKITELVHPDDYEKNMQDMRDHLENRKNFYESTYRIRTKEGPYKWYYDRGSIVERDNAGKPLTVTGIVVDITSLQNIEKELEQEKRFVNDILESLPAAATKVDKKGRIIYANQAALKLFGLKREEIYNRTYDDSKWEIEGIDGKPIDPAELPFSIAVHKGKMLHDYRHYIKIPPDDKKLLSINGAPSFDYEKNINGAVFIMNVIAEDA